MSGMDDKEPDGFEGALCRVAVEYAQEVGAAFPSAVRIKLAREKLVEAAEELTCNRLELYEEYPDD